MTNPIGHFHDESGEYDRELTDEEYASLQASKAAILLREQREEKAAIDKAALLKRLGITADEVRLLLG